MARRESKKFKALYFDLKIKELKIHYSATAPRAYPDIKNYERQQKFKQANRLLFCHSESHKILALQLYVHYNRCCQERK